MRTVAQYEQYAATHHTRSDGTPWATAEYSRCVALVFSAGGFSRSFTTAALAGDYVLAHHGLDKNPATAHVGEFDYWTNHIALRTENGDLMASHAAHSIATGLGYLTYEQYDELEPAQHYRGHSPYFGDQTLAGLSLASTGETILIPQTETDTDMYMFTPKDDGTYVKKGYSYLIGVEGILRPLGSAESVLWRTPVSADLSLGGGGGLVMQLAFAATLDAMANQNGIYEVVWAGTEPTLTGRIIRGGIATYPKVSGGGSTVSVDLSTVTTALTTAEKAIIAAIPTAAQTATAVRAKIIAP